MDKDSTTPQPTDPRLRFPRNARLRRNADFQRVYREGSRERGRLITLVAAPNGTDESRLGVSVGRRFAKRAVDRNRAKRLMREAFRIERPTLPRGWDLVLIPANPQVQLTLEALRRELVLLTGKAASRRRPS